LGENEPILVWFVCSSWAHWGPRGENEKEKKLNDRPRQFAKKPRGKKTKNKLGGKQHCTTHCMNHQSKGFSTGREKKKKKTTGERNAGRMGGGKKSKQQIKRVGPKVSFYKKRWTSRDTTGRNGRNGQTSGSNQKKARGEKGKWRREGKYRKEKLVTRGGREKLAIGEKNDPRSGKGVEQEKVPKTAQGGPD